MDCPSCGGTDLIKRGSKAGSRIRETRKALGDAVEVEAVIAVYKCSSIGRSNSGEADAGHEQDRGLTHVPNPRS